MYETKQIRNLSPACVTNSGSISSDRISCTISKLVREVGLTKITHEKKNTGAGIVLKGEIGAPTPVLYLLTVMRHRRI